MEKRAFKMWFKNVNKLGLRFNNRNIKDINPLSPLIFIHLICSKIWLFKWFHFRQTTTFSYNKTTRFVGLLFTHTNLRTSRETPPFPAARHIWCAEAGVWANEMLMLSVGEWRKTSVLPYLWGRVSCDRSGVLGCRAPYSWSLNRNLPSIRQTRTVCAQTHNPPPSCSHFTRKRHVIIIHLY